MATKLSELLKANNLTLDDLEDDELNLSLSEVKKRLKANQDGYTKATQTVGERERQLQDYHNALQQWQAHAQQLEARSQTLEQQIAKRAEDVQRQGGDWKRDPLFQDLVADFDGISSGIIESREASKALAQGLVGIATRYTADRGAVLNWIDQAEQRFMKQDNPDFDADEIRKWAKENGVNTSWKDSYVRYKASKLPETEAKIRAEEREKVLAEHGDKLSRPVETEMGSSSRPAPPVGGAAKKEYKDAWSGLAGELEKAGVARI
jgi:hypothetical protein